MKKALFVMLLACYLAVVVPLADHLRNRPVAIKLGYTPSADVLKIVSADQRYAVAEGLLLKVLFYYGSLIDKWQNRVNIPPETHNMYKTVETAVQLDPYGVDGYYFAQGAFTWEVGHAADVNRMLEYGMKYRTWDWLLPFFVGFNSAYFLHDYPQAAQYMKKAAEISGNPLFTKLAARYFYESGRSELGILFLETMEKQAKDPLEKRMYEMRRQALLAVEKLNQGIEKFRSKYGRLPRDLSELVATGILERLPADPYGGTFYLDSQGKVRSTSKFAEKKDAKPGH